MVGMITIPNLIARPLRLFKISIHPIYEFNIWSKSIIISGSHSLVYIYIILNNFLCRIPQNA
jgi:hypothetical protein